MRAHAAFINANIGALNHHALPQKKSARPSLARSLLFPNVQSTEATKLTNHISPEFQ
jgi:hypothetical protein